MTRFSVVYPTRDRPQFVAAALRFLENSNFKDFEIIISDNPSSPEKNCLEQIKNTKLRNIKYFRADKPVSMVDNWNSALSRATGDYVLFLTDKMLLLPNTLLDLNQAVNETGAEIVSWVDNSYSPSRFPQYFGEGTYIRRGTHIFPRSSQLFSKYSPQRELLKKANAQVSRSRQSPSHYARGKILFGAYSRSLIERVKAKAGNLFHDLSPDYTSMICALYLAESAIELRNPGVVHISTDLSNGGRMAANDSLVSQWLLSTNRQDEILNDMVIPGLYSSQHAVVSHDYVSMKRKFGIGFSINKTNWTKHCFEDLNMTDREWSSLEVRQSQLAKLNKAIDHMPSLDRFMLRRPFRKILYLLSRVKSAIIYIFRKSTGKIRRLDSIYEILGEFQINRLETQ